ncbi:lasso peptide biosynthesis B2 protein [Xanthomonas rydalmerensis]|uniref:Lasso peptide biosynthesis B2 protein n=1 Tax=Xanthomonas rydalmerensis TaxID=3046274 RepID=A0ABZ0JN61_9XANT|nr:lasso peptide biosynthesis B2 protein [Xanthomonas sp. DM-2023]WOS40470.1 lasso peptide biosynthesis B2 protein [Xanthomonas sp. DM-2023]WOS44654.1 lasso peptide biosynthesis B2 protein [Xanthomonas sp. DM-2023]WOS48834.1 lasso peptide biosynthesis B2 protein [Xanthomonas sp. DM-2023]WOS53014.1 lasso peptide biosynthesis B2 protein [Xanthomonas sp. DM-2023]WOS57198.1 lasso peptide biosynthesis B2 protein [Xanthomonas sp. DM-2023]
MPGGLSGFLRLPRFERCLLVPAWVLLGAARAAVLALGFRRLAPCLGRGVAEPPPAPVLDARAQRRAIQIGRTLRLAARHTPWESNCLAQALSARCLLGLFRVPHMLCFGAARAPETLALQAHAWVVAGPVRVTGGGGVERFARIGCFVVPAEPRR